MAKLVIRDLTDVRFATVKAVFDEVAEDCSILSVSDDDNYKLILTVDTDLVISMQLAEATNSFGARSVVFNGNTLVTNSGTSNPSSVRLIIAYTDTFFLVWIKFYSSTTNILFSFYEKLGSEKFAYGTTSTSLPGVSNLYNMDYKQYNRMTYNSGFSYALPTNYIDYEDSTVLVYNGVRAPEFDTNFIYVISLISIAPTTTITIGNKDYYAITSQYLIPIDDE